MNQHTLSYILCRQCPNHVSLFCATKNMVHPIEIHISDHLGCDGEYDHRLITLGVINTLNPNLAAFCEDWQDFPKLKEWEEGLVSRHYHHPVSLLLQEFIDKVLVDMKEKYKKYTNCKEANIINGYKVNTVVYYDDITPVREIIQWLPTICDNT